MTNTETLAAVGVLRLILDADEEDHIWFEVGDKPKVQMSETSVRIRLVTEDLEELIALYLESMGLDEDDESEEVEELDFDDGGEGEE